MARGSARLADSTIYSYASYAFKLSLISYRTFKKAIFSYSLSCWQSVTKLNIDSVPVLGILKVINNSHRRENASLAHLYTVFEWWSTTFMLSRPLAYLATITSSYSLSLWTNRQTHSYRAFRFSNILQTYFSANSLRHVSENIQARLVIDFVKKLHFLWSPYVIGQTIIFSSCFFLLSFFLSSSSSFFYSSPNLSGRRLDVYHTLAHTVALVRI